MSEDKKIVEDQQSDIAVIDQVQQSTIITYKKKLRTTLKNHIQDNKENYLAFLKENMMMLYSGEIGVYLTSKVNFNGQNLYFPFINIDGDRGSSRDEKIVWAIEDTYRIYNILKELNADRYFHFISTGNTGFRIVSNILLNIDNYRAFIAFLQREMRRHIKDIRSTELVESKAHQLFAYIGHPNQQKKDNLVDRHSVVIPNHIFENGDMIYEYYQDKTKGNADSTVIINFMESFLNFRPKDLDSLGEFGERLKKYCQPPREATIRKTFNLIKNFGESIPRSLSLKLTLENLQSQNIPCKIENRMGKDLISFTDLPCPICHDTTSEAWAAYPDYSLRCRNIKGECPAALSLSGIPLENWAGFSPIISTLDEIQRNNPLLRAPTEFVSKEEARDGIANALSTEDDSLVLVTPGVGKTFSALKYLSALTYSAENIMDKLVLYCSLNKKLRDQAHDDMMNFSVWFKLTDRSLGELKNENIPEDIVLLLNELKDQVCIGEEQFEEILKNTIGEENTKTYKFLIFNYACFSDRRDFVYKIESMQDLCPKFDEIEELTKKGFSPRGMICDKCEHDFCMYNFQRTTIGKGIYFITHHMLKYLKALISEPDIIILDENLLAGFFLEEEFEEAQIKTLTTVLDPPDYMIIDQIIKIGQELGSP